MMKSLISKDVLVRLIGVIVWLTVYAFFAYLGILIMWMGYQLLPILALLTGMLFISFYFVLARRIFRKIYGIILSRIGMDTIPDDRDDEKF